MRNPGKDLLSGGGSSSANRGLHGRSMCCSGPRHLLEDAVAPAPLKRQKNRALEAELTPRYWVVGGLGPFDKSKPDGGGVR
jgi:hypothetical protein